MKVHGPAFEDIQALIAILPKIETPEEREHLVYMLERWAYCAGFADGVVNLSLADAFKTKETK